MRYYTSRYSIYLTDGCLEALLTQSRLYTKSTVHILLFVLNNIITRGLCTFQVLFI